jgi:3-oxoacyl-[acyl-carrier-protein] synthase II
MNERRVAITGLGPISALGVGMEPTWEAMLEGRCALAPLEAFDATGFDSWIGGEVRDFKAGKVVPKSYRKAVKVMARDIELAVGAADAAARDAGLITKGTADGDADPTYPSHRMGAHIGAPLISADIDELTVAMADSLPEGGTFDYQKFGSEGITQVTPLWLLKYLPNMLACHVTIIHDAQGPSNTITCNEASSGLSVGESLRVIQRGQADLCFCGGAESKLNPLGWLRNLLTERVNTQDNDRPHQAVRPFDQSAAGSVTSEGGGIVILEAVETLQQRGGKAYAELLGFGASQSINRAARNLKPEPDGRGIASAIRAALREARLEPDAIDMIVPFGLGYGDYDRAEAAALKAVFGERIKDIPLVAPKAMAGSCGAGAGGLDICIAAKAIAEQTVPARINCDNPIEGLCAATAKPQAATLRHVLTCSTSLGGQNAAIILGKPDSSAT